MMMNKKKASNENQLKTYDGAVIIVTGGASGIGRAIAEELASQGARAIVLMDRQIEEAQTFATSLHGLSTSTEVKAREVDVRNYQDVERVVKETHSVYGRLDYIFNNAGTSVIGTAEEIGVEGFSYTVDVNLKGVFHGVCAAYPIMKQQGYGHIVNTASVAGLFPGGEGWAAYGASKYGVIGLSTNLRIEASRHGVQVTVLCPGVIRTELLKGAGKFGIVPRRISQDEMDKLWEEFHPMDPQIFATKALRLVAKNKPIVVVPAQPYRTIWCISRYFPSLGFFIARKQNDKIVQRLREPKTSDSFGGRKHVVEDSETDVHV